MHLPHRRAVIHLRCQKPTHEHKLALDSGVEGALYGKRGKDAQRPRKQSLRRLLRCRFDHRPLVAVVRLGLAPACAHQPWARRGWGPLPAGGTTRALVTR